MAKRSNWRGCSDVDMVYYNNWADPDLVITVDGQEYVFNYWDIEDALWYDFCDSMGYEPAKVENDSVVEDEFNNYCQDTAYSYMEDCIYGGYFADGSYSWHDRY